MNKKRVKELADYMSILDNEKYDQRNYSFLECGSPSCIAGHAVALAYEKHADEVSDILKNLDYYENDSQLNDILKQPRMIDEFVMIWLGLTSSQCHDLFTAWPAGFGGPCYPTNKQASELLHNLIETDKVDWKAVNY